ncbi:MAG: hypothetical protein JSR34_06440 [Proteobacteria bacterium]|nr:hypothetical protein [Pseudomonadota bacterium]
METAIQLVLPDGLERSMSAQWDRLREREPRDKFARLIETGLVTLLAKAIDWDLQEPTPDEIAYLMVMWEEFGTVPPKEATQFRGAYFEFLENFEPRQGQETSS